MTRRNTIFDNEASEKYFRKSKPGLMGNGFIGEIEAAKKEKKQKRIFPTTGDFL